MTEIWSYLNDLLEHYIFLGFEISMKNEQNDLNLLLSGW